MKKEDIIVNDDISDIAEEENQQTNAIETTQKNYEFTHLRSFQIKIYDAQYLEPFFHLSSTLVDLELSYCKLIDTKCISLCPSLVRANLSFNEIAQIDSSLKCMKYLKMLNLNNNILANINEFENLPGSLMYFSCQNNAIQAYRSCLIELLPLLCAIDHNFITDTEYLFKHKNSIFKSVSCLDPRLVESTPYDVEFSLRNRLSLQVKCLSNYHRSISSIYKLQNLFKMWRQRCKMFRLGQKFVKFQACIRGALFRMKILHHMSFAAQEAGIPKHMILSMENAVEVTRAVIAVQKFWRGYAYKQLLNKKARILQSWMKRECFKLKMLTSHMNRVKLNEFFIYGLSLNQCLYFKDSIQNSLKGNTRMVDSISRISITSSDTFTWFISSEGRVICEVRRCSLSDAIQKFLRQRKSLQCICRTVLNYCSHTQQKKLLTIKRRGFNLYGTFPANKSFHANIQRRVLEVDPNPKHELLSVSSPDCDFKTLIKIKRRISSLLKGSKGKILWGPVVYRNSSAISIQRVYRGYKYRKHMCKLLVDRIIQTRAIMAIQRWWRMTNGLKRRLHLLGLIYQRCHSIHESVLYMDLWVYFLLLRCIKLPINDFSTHLAFPEYNGYPIVANGIVCYQPIHPKLLASGNAIQVPVPPNDSIGNSPIYLRSRKLISTYKYTGNRRISDWLNCKPTKLLNAKPIKDISDQAVLFSILTQNCKVDLRAFPISGESQEVINLIQLSFASVKEARIRCGMLMLLCYDPLKRDSISFQTWSEISSSIHLSNTPIASPSKVTIVNAGNYTSCNSKSPVLPLEVRTSLRIYSDLWVVSHVLQVRDILHFQFMLESMKLSQQSSLRSTLTSIDKPPVQPRNNIDEKFMTDEIDAVDEGEVVNEYYDVLEQGKTIQLNSEMNVCRLIPSRPNTSKLIDEEPNSLENKEKLHQIIHRRIKLIPRVWDTDRILLWCFNMANKLDLSFSRNSKSLYGSTGTDLALIKRIELICNANNLYGTTPTNETLPQVQVRKMQRQSLIRPKSAKAILQNRTFEEVSEEKRRRLAMHNRYFEQEEEKLVEKQHLCEQAKLVGIEAKVMLERTKQAQIQVVSHARKNEREENRQVIFSREVVKLSNCQQIVTHVKEDVERINTVLTSRKKTKSLSGIFNTIVNLQSQRNRKQNNKKSEEEDMEIFHDKLDIVMREASIQHELRKQSVVPPERTTRKSSRSHSLGNRSSYHSISHNSQPHSITQTQTRVTNRSYISIPTNPEQLLLAGPIHVSISRSKDQLAQNSFLSADSSSLASLMTAGSRSQSEVLGAQEYAQN